MKYRTSWADWCLVPLDKKKEFWAVNDFDYTKAFIIREDGEVIESAQYIPTIIEMIRYLEIDGFRKAITDEHGTVLGQGLEGLNQALWDACKLKLLI